MATIVALCPYCHAGGVRAPASSVGASATCPKCGSSFTVMPSEGVPGWAGKPQGQPAPSAPLAPRPSRSDETKPAAALPDETEPSPVIPPDARPERAKPARPPVVEESEADEPGLGGDVGLVVALLGLSLVGVAVLATFFPFGRFIATGVAGIGFVAGLASLGAEGRARLLGGLAMALHSLILAIVLVAPSWLNLDPWRGKPTDEGPQGPQAYSHADQRTTPANWVDPASSSWQFKDVRVSVRSAHVGPVELTGPKGAKRITKEPYLHLVLRVANVGVERQVGLSGWAIRQNVEGVQLADSAGKTLKPATFEEGWVAELGKPVDQLYPSKSAEVRLIFASPPNRTDYFRLQLPASATGLAEEIKFQIGSGFFTRTPTP